MNVFCYTVGTNNDGGTVVKASTIAILFAAIPALAFAETPDRFVRYVESTGSQYVDTGVTGRWNTRVEAELEWMVSSMSSLLRFRRFVG